MFDSAKVTSTEQAGSLVAISLFVLCLRERERDGRERGGEEERKNLF